MPGLIRKSLFCLEAVFALTFCSAHTSLAVDLKVTGDRVSLRAAPKDNAEVVSQVSSGEILVADKGVDGEWIEVVPPSRVNLWVYGELVNDGVVQASKVKVRVGPGINYRPVGELQQDDKITVKGEYREWLKIAPPPSCRVWINRKYVDAIDKPANVEPGPVRENKPFEPTEKPEAGRTTALAKPPVKHPVPLIVDESPKSVERREISPLPPPPRTGPAIRTSISPEALIRDKLVASKEQGRKIGFSGVLRVSGFFVWRQPSKYRLVSQVGNSPASTVCYVMGDEAKLASLRDANIEVSGREYWLQGVRQPVVIADSIVVKGRN